jgi:tol-pal system protein YbgF
MGSAPAGGGRMIAMIRSPKGRRSGGRRAPRVLRVFRVLRVLSVPSSWVVAVLGATATSGCFATRDDVRVLQENLSSLRSERLAADSVQRAQIDRVLAQLALANDSLRVLTARTTKWQGDVSGDLYQMGQQLIQIQELTGQSQVRLLELRAQVEQQHAATVTPPPTTFGAGGMPADTTHGSAAGGPPGPGPNQLFQLALEQLRRGSTGAARAGFQDLLRQYPNADVAADAHFELAEVAAREGSMAAADSAYLDVVARYPTSARAPTALFKHAAAMEAAGKMAAAKAAYQDVIRKYPRSDEAVLAKDRLRDLK